MELNLILAFIFLASKTFRPPSAILYAASTNTIPYFTFWQRLNLILPESSYRLRPVNVPFKPKWLHDTVKLLDVAQVTADGDKYLAIVTVDLGL